MMPSQASETKLSDISTQSSNGRWPRKSCMSTSVGVIRFHWLTHLSAFSMRGSVQ